MDVICFLIFLFLLWTGLLVWECPLLTAPFFSAVSFLDSIVRRTGWCVFSLLFLQDPWLFPLLFSRLSPRETTSLYLWFLSKSNTSLRLLFLVLHTFKSWCYVLVYPNLCSVFCTLCWIFSFCRYGGYFVLCQYLWTTLLFLTESFMPPHYQFSAPAGLQQ